MSNTSQVTERATAVPSETSAHFVFASTKDIFEGEAFLLRTTGGTSAGEHSLGFLPAFADGETGLIYLSRHADGRPALVHCIAGLPDEVMVARSDGLCAVKPSVVAGFVRSGRFYSRAQAAAFAASVTEPAV